MKQEGERRKVKELLKRGCPIRTSRGIIYLAVLSKSWSGGKKTSSEKTEYII
ncbi:hypothetical protein B0G66_1366 [Bacillus badius]|nr:hypothetical protein B0G66_1366 [Bacillus badius]